MSLKYNTTGLLFQQFSIPTPIMRYVCYETNLSPELYYKLYFCCKYFYQKIAVLPVFGIDFVDDNSLGFLYNSKYIIISTEQFQNSSFKIFLFRQLGDRKEILHGKERVMQLRTRIIRCNVKILVLFYECSLTFKEYKYLTANIGHLTMGHVVVKDENDQVVPVEDLLACIPNCFHFDFEPGFGTLNKGYTNKSAQKMAGLSMNAKMFGFSLFGDPETFNAEAFSTFIKKTANSKNKSSLYRILYAESVDENRRTAFKETVETLLKQWVLEHKEFSFYVA